MTPAEHAADVAAEADLDLREALRSHRVSRLLRRIAFGSCRLLDGSHTGAEPSRDFIEGQRSIGRWLVDELFRVDPQLAAQWWGEYAEERVERQAFAKQTDAVRGEVEG